MTANRSNAASDQMFALWSCPFRVDDRVCDRRHAADAAVLGRAAPARQSVSRASGGDGAARPRLRGGARRRRPHPRAAGQLCPRAHRPAQGVEIDPTRRPFVVVDPRAGHGPGIGGFKADSEIGVAFKAGHPCYFVGFLPEPMPGQTIEDIARAEAIFLEKVIALHPEADGKPCVIGNCQAGWAVMMLAALRPELFGPIIIAGSPLSYWAGVHGKNPMRYSGGLLGGSWLTALTSDLGGGKFDGAWLVQNFENQNPANTLWTKQYNLYSKIDTEAPRYLGFERWWGGHVNLNAEEIQFIVDELFIGNNLAAGRDSDVGRQQRSTCAISARRSSCSARRATTSRRRSRRSDGSSISMRTSTKSAPTARRSSTRSTRSVGHLGIFVSGGVAAQGAWRVLQQHRPDRRAAARPLRGDVRGEDRGHGRRRSRHRRVGHALRGADARRHPRARRQRCGGRAPVRDRGARVGDQSRPLPRRSCSRSCARDDLGPVAECDAAAASAAAAIRALLRRKSADGARSRRWPIRCAQDRRPVAADNPFLAMRGERHPGRSSPPSTPGGT